MTLVRLTVHADPALSPRDYSIADAAAKAGFNCRDWNKLKGLIGAVRTATQPAVRYPDRWTGPAAYQSPNYPDTWKPAEDIGQGRSLPRIYEEGGRSPSVPAFVIPAAQLIKDTTSYPDCRASNAAVAPHSKRVPLGPRSVNKRTIDQPRSELPARKRARSEMPNFQNAANHIPVIDLTDDSPISQVQYVPSRPQQAPPVTNKAMKNRRKRERQRQSSLLGHQARSQRVTNITLSRVLDGLEGSAFQLDKDRDGLRQRWEVDTNLQLQTVTDHLGELNECFTRAEEAIAEGIAIVRERLL